MNKKEKKFLLDNGWEFVKKGVSIDNECLSESDDGETFYPSLKDIPHRKCNYWVKDDIASDDEERILEYAGYEDKD